MTARHSREVSLCCLSTSYYNLILVVSSSLQHVLDAWSMQKVFTTLRFSITESPYFPALHYRLLALSPSVRMARTTSHSFDYIYFAILINNYG